MSRIFISVLIVSVVFAHMCDGQRRPRCCRNETVSDCGRLCEPSCENKHPNLSFCPPYACERQTEPCRCKRGYVRNVSIGKCILYKDCPPNSELIFPTK